LNHEADEHASKELTPLSGKEASCFRTLKRT
jgi:hypothetical protein